MSDQDFVAEKVLGKKTKNGKVHYQIKWVGYDDPEDITWEPFDNCWHCIDKIIEYDESLKKGKQAPQKPKEAAPTGPQRVKQPKIDYSLKPRVSDYPKPGKVYRLDRGSTIEKILGVKRCVGFPGVVALVAYTDKTLEIVPTRVIAENQPEVLLEYYEARLHNGGTPQERTADAALEQELKKDEDVAQQKRMEDVVQELTEGLAVGDDAKKD
ncbi:heterochromatin-associated protein [Aphelenchoides avenae]|nr:heterochromatin-associated protein [Aphelenchus avenae]